MTKSRVVVMRAMIMVMRETMKMVTMTVNTWEDVVCKGKRREIGVRDVDCHKGEEVREGK